MKIDDLKLFVKVVELGSFTAAANALDLPRANVSRRISELESKLSVPLFHRTTRSLSLTNQGEIYHQELLKALALFDHASHAINQSDERVSGKIKLGMLSETHDVLQPILFDFIDQHPDVELDVRVIQNGFIDMYQQGLDIAFHGGGLIDSDLIARKILPLDRCLVAAPSYITQHGLADTIQALAEHTALCFRWPNGEVDNRWQFAEGEIKVSSKFVSNSIAFIKDSALSGRGIAFLPRILVAKELESGGLVHILQQYKATAEHGYLLYPQPRTLNLASRALIQHLIQEIPKLA
ncbi:LysR family transcriptional regulator [Vibrio panuliri]|uniref:Transcriptional regulator n=1 Tax=Vibrio panuliri TaxID=1381081 RepID=A0ABX3FJ67_9VIBR|nr:LysR family transcriptional regulator [Vibrio panuliri]KAB1454671.1 LysR family transcriptional regulator [Vibrio panuliri]OLQ94133.1 transcriptional regulator [Vibrio panuliri]